MLWLTARWNFVNLAFAGLLALAPLLHAFA